VIYISYSEEHVLSVASSQIAGFLPVEEATRLRREALLQWRPVMES
jgi:hypothetical protein